jgi:hypothetical protein
LWIPVYRPRLRNHSSRLSSRISCTAKYWWEARNCCRIGGRGTVMCLVGRLVYVPFSVVSRCVNHYRKYFFFCQHKLLAFLADAVAVWDDMHAIFRPSFHLQLMYCTMLGVTWSLLTTNCTCYATEDTVRIVNSFITILITRNYNHSQLFLTLLHVYTIIILTRS